MISGIGGSTGYLSNMMSEMRRQQTKSASQMSEELFSKADANGDGTVDETELAQALSSQSKVGSGDGPSAEELFDFLDADGDGGITEQEHTDGLQTRQDQLQGQQDSMAMMGMLEMMGMKAPSDDEQSSSGLFSELDSNGDGVIDADELTSALESRQAQGGNGPSADELFATLDADGDGSITKQEHGDGLQAMRTQREAGGFSANLMASALQQYQSMSQGVLGMQAMTQVSFFA